MSRYDRQLLLLGPKRNQVLELWEVERYGTDSFGDPNYVSIFGMRPREWHARGVRLLGRTAVECTRDTLGKAIGRDIAGIALTCTSGGAMVIDPFAEAPRFTPTCASCFLTVGDTGWSGGNATASRSRVVGGVLQSGFSGDADRAVEHLTELSKPDATRRQQ